MTKKVRVENADNSDHIVNVQTWQKGFDGNDDQLMSETPLTYPTDIGDFLIHSGQFLVIKEPEQ